VSRAGVLGHPVGHSLSPALHNAAYDALGLEGWRYDAVDVTEAELPAFMAALAPDWAGLSLTMPLKRAVLPLLQGVSPLAEALGVVNTVTFPPAGPVGDNTDVHGMVEALRAAGVTDVGSGTVLGGGATATSAVAALRDLGCAAPVVHVRSLERAGAVRSASARLGVPVELRRLEDRSWSGADVVISTLPAGAGDALVPAVSARGVLLDAAYDPWPSRLASSWAAAGAPVVDGFEMLLHQAAAQVLLMTGREAPVEAMRAAGLAARAR
jgi:shikimate dehydrogenase